MAPALMIVAMLLGWLSAAMAMLWGMLRIARRRQPRPDQAHRETGPALPAAPTGRHTRFIFCVTSRLRSVECTPRDGAVW
ncbi:hypothetical protein [Pseudomonas oligotrophica]|uniref:hypothetical protein n=1 Tax=Pseudomonas oligotrophica TaxID=2912055 RepID=UPI001F3928F5|nr:hypothetical protein [Pseudomonas oligotrophica]MCF7202886.1 hypothetical protein [Pseudomonas oligotrophica]